MGWENFDGNVRYLNTKGFVLLFYVRKYRSLWNKSVQCKEIYYTRLVLFRMFLLCTFSIWSNFLSSGCCCFVVVFFFSTSELLLQVNEARRFSRRALVEKMCTQPEKHCLYGLDPSYDGNGLFSCACALCDANLWRMFRSWHRLCGWPSIHYIRQIGNWFSTENNLAARVFWWRTWVKLSLGP